MTGLRELRVGAGYTQESIAQKLGYKYTSGYNQIENGKRKLDFEAAKILSELYNTTIEEIYCAYQVVKMSTESKEKAS
jgi:DNA-binding XRE family transcriptional regulator